MFTPPFTGSPSSMGMDSIKFGDANSSARGGSAWSEGWKTDIGGPSMVDLSVGSGMKWPTVAIIAVAAVIIAWLFSR